MTKTATERRSHEATKGQSKIENQKSKMSCAAGIEDMARLMKAEDGNLSLIHI